jgi:hypothetical protein
MANFRVDFLELILNEANGKYSLTGRCNTNQTPNGNVIQGDLVGLELIFNTHNLQSNDYLSFSSQQEVDFSTLNVDGSESYSLQFDDVPAGPAGKLKKGGIVIKDTKYPPPIQLTTLDRHKGFTSQFKIKSVTCTRLNSTSNNFKVNVKLLFSSAFANYTIDSFVSYTDTIRNSQKIMRLNVNQDFDNMPHSNPTGTPLNFDNNSINLNHSYGIPIIVLDKNVTWNEDIDYKKSNIYIV